MTELLSLFPRQGEWTEDDYFNLLPESNRIIELSEGRLIIPPSPTSLHQRACAQLTVLLGSYVRLHKAGEFVAAPMDTRLWKGKIRQPDIEFMSNEHLGRIKSALWGVPDLVMEVFSEGTITTDKEDKFQEYEKAGIREYWIVDPSEQTIEIYTLENGTYELFGKWHIGETAKSKLLDGLEVSVEDVII